MKNRQKPGVFFQITVFCLALLFISACATDKKDFEKAKQLNSISGYKEFLQKHPEGEWSEKAREGIAILTEDNDYRALVSEGKLFAYMRFAKKYPNSKYKSEVEKRINEWLAKSLKGKSRIKLRGWISEGNTLVEIIIPLPARKLIELSKYELRSGGQVLGTCIGIVPPDYFWGGQSGTIYRFRKNKPLPVSGLYPAKKLKERKIWTNILVRNFFYPIGYKNSLIVGQHLSMKREDKESFNLLTPNITYLLLNDGFQVTSERSRKSTRWGFKVPLKKEVPLLFAVPSLTKTILELVADDGSHFYVSIQQEK